MQRKKFDSIRLKLNRLAIVDDDLRKMFQLTINENTRLTQILNSWNKSFAFIGKIHEM